MSGHATAVPRSRLLPRIRGAGHATFTRRLLLLALATVPLVAALLIRWESPGGAVAAALAATALLALPGLSLTGRVTGRLGLPEALAVGLTVAIAIVPMGAYLLSLAGAPFQLWTVIAVAVALTALAVGLAAAEPGPPSPPPPPPSAEPPAEESGLLSNCSTATHRTALIGAGLLLAALLAWKLRPLPLAGGAIAYSAAVLVLLVRRSEAATGAAAIPHRIAALGATALVAAIAVPRLLLFVYSAAPLGYDSGIYRGLQRAWAGALPDFPEFATGSHESIQEPGLFVLTDVLHLLGWSTDATLWGPLIGFYLLMAGGVWLLAHDLGGRGAGLWALLLFALSSTQLTAFWHVYLKQAVALTLLLYTLWLWRRESWLAVPLGAVLGGAHTMTFLLAGLILFSDFLWPDTEQRTDGPTAYLRGTKRYQLVAGALTLGLGLSFYLASPAPIADYLSVDPFETARNVGVGADVSRAFAFSLSIEDFLRLTWPIAPFAVASAVMYARSRAARPVLLMAGWSTAAIVVGLLFRERFAIPLDLALIILASPLLAAATATMATTATGAALWSRRLGRGALAAGVVLLAGMFLLTFDERGPFLPSREVEAIEDARAAVPAGAYFMATHSRYSPWVFGYGERDTIAPGLFQFDQWTADEWQLLWDPPTPEARHELLDRYDRPIYIHVGESQRAPRFDGDPRFVPVAPRVWRYIPGPAGTP